MLIGSGPRVLTPAGDGERDAFGEGELLRFATGGDLRGVRRVEVATILSALFLNVPLLSLLLSLLLSSPHPAPTQLGGDFRRAISDRRIRVEFNKSNKTL